MQIAIIGGGASGLICAAKSAYIAKKQNQKAQITVFEANDRVGKKLLVTGNGRCNMTNVNISPKFYLRSNDYAAFALEKYSPKKTLEFFSRLGLLTRTDDHGRVYPMSNQANSVLDCLRFECERLGVKFECGKVVRKIENDGCKFIINSAFCFDKIVLACGGMAGVNFHNGYKLLQSLGHTVIAPTPSLVKLSTANTYTRQLKGVRAFVRLRLTLGGNILAEEDGEIIFGDGVLSGIAVMQLSASLSRVDFTKSKKVAVHCDFAPNIEKKELLAVLLPFIKNNTAKSENLLVGVVPKRIGMMILKTAAVSLDKPISAITAKQIEKIIDLMKDYEFEINSLCSFRDAQVTAGGASTKEFDSRTMQSKKVKGLFCCGELMDVDGVCGGYNLQWAWSSGLLCADNLFNNREKSKND